MERIWNFSKELEFVKMRRSRTEKQVSEIKNSVAGTSLLVRWLRFPLAVQGRQV